MFPCSQERFFDGTDQENSKTTRRKGTDQENLKKQEGKNGGKKKKRFPCTWRFPYSGVPIHMDGNALGLLPSCNPPSGEPTSMGTFPTTKSKNNRFITPPPKKVLFY
jgi:hypothetical protein